MASLSVPCPKTIAFSGASQLNRSQYNQIRHRLISFRWGPKSNPALLSIQGSKQSQNDVFKVCAQLNEVAIKKSSNSSPVPQTKSEESPKKPAYAIPDAASISAFMTQVADLVELVDSRDIVELQLKQQDCEVTIRKKEALPQPPDSAPVYMMQPHSSPAVVESQLPQVQVSGPVSASPAPSAPASPPPTPAKPKSTHPPLKCPMAGTFYRSPAPGAPAFVKVGDKVQKGQVICIIEAMKLMNEIEADHSGTVVEVIAEDGKPVSVDTPLFIIEP